jgi:hypothetical protein
MQSTWVAHWADGVLRRKILDAVVTCAIREGICDRGGVCDVIVVAAVCLVAPSWTWSQAPLRDADTHLLSTRMSE